MREREGLFKSRVTFDSYRRRRARVAFDLSQLQNNTRIFSFHRFTTYSRRTEKRNE